MSIVNPGDQCGESRNPFNAPDYKIDSIIRWTLFIYKIVCDMHNDFMCIWDCFPKMMTMCMFYIHIFTFQKYLITEMEQRYNLYLITCCNINMEKLCFWQVITYLFGWLSNLYFQPRPLHRILILYSQLSTCISH